MQQLAAAFGTFIGYALGHMLRISGPELKDFLIGVIRDAMAKTYTVAKPTDAFQSDPDLAGVLPVRESGDSGAAGNGSENGQGTEGRAYSD